MTTDSQTTLQEFDRARRRADRARKLLRNAKSEGQRRHALALLLASGAVLVSDPAGEAGLEAAQARRQAWLAGNK